jgi:hypothetical protein
MTGKDSYRINRTGRAVRDGRRYSRRVVQVAKMGSKAGRTER